MSFDPYSLMATLDDVKHRSHPPIHLWQPDVVKDIDMEIHADGSWYYLGTPIKRPKLVRLFSTVLRREGDEFFLVTPVEKCRIQVEDAPFQAVLMDVDGEGESQQLRFTTNTAEQVTADAQHAIRIEMPDSAEPSPYVHIRDGLDARLSRNVYYQLMDLVVPGTGDSADWHGIYSSGEFFPVIENSQLN